MKFSNDGFSEWINPYFSHSQNMMDIHLNRKVKSHRARNASKRRVAKMVRCKTTKISQSHKFIETVNAMYWFEGGLIKSLDKPFHRCRRCGGSGLGYCDRCLGTGECRYIMGFQFMKKDTNLDQDNRRCKVRDRMGSDSFTELLLNNDPLDSGSESWILMDLWKLFNVCRSSSGTFWLLW